LVITTLFNASFWFHHCTLMKRR